MAKPSPKAASGLQVVQKSVDSLIPYARNARTHSEEQVAQIAGSIKEFGFNDPIAVDQDGVIIEGHGRVLAARKLGLPEVPVIVLAHMSESQKRAYILAHNKIALNAGWNDDMLKAEILTLQSEDVDLSSVGFDAVAIGEMLEDKSIDLDEQPKEEQEERQALCCPKCGFRFEVKA